MQSSHAAHRNENSGRASTESLILADAFAEFISASSRLETFYGDLQKEVSQLGQELTDRNAALHASLNQSETACRMLQQVLDTLPCAVVVTDEADCVSFMNTEAGRLVGVSAHHLDQERAEPLSAELLKWMHASAASRQECDFVFHAGGIHRQIAVRSRQVGDAQADSVPGTGLMVAVLRDISSQREIEHERLQRHKAAMVAEVTADLAEEIRSPLASIELFTSLIAKEKGDASRWIAHLRTSTRALVDTLDHALCPGGK